MADFRKLTAVALLSGIFAGFILSVVQHFNIQPLILAAERFEIADAGHASQWQPENGLQRNAFTALFNSLSGFGFALPLCAAMYWHGKSGYLRGLLWGLGGYYVFFAAPALGLPPELPGADSAALRDRQVWWLFTVAGSAIGLLLLCFGKPIALRLAGGVLLLIPHLIGAPHPEILESVLPPGLRERFVLSSAICNSLFWLALGGMAGWLLPRFKL